MVVDVDVETTGLQWYYDEMFLAQFSDGSLDADGKLVVDVLRHPEDREKIAAWLQYAVDQKARLRAFNSKFDFHFLDQAGYTLPPQEFWDDAMVKAVLVNETIPAALQARADRLLGAESGAETEIAVKDWLAAEKKRRRKASKDAIYDWLEEQGLPQKRNRNPQVPDGLAIPEELAYVEPNYSDVPTEIMDPYAAHDIVVTRRVDDIYEPKLIDRPRQVYEEIEQPVLGALYDLEKRGMPVDKPAAQRLLHASTVKLEELHATARELAGGKSNFNPGSSDQVAQALLREGADLRFVDKHQSGKYKMDEENLSAVDHPLADAILDFRAEKKMMSTYVYPMLYPTVQQGIPRQPFIGPDGRIHTNIRQVGARTGRSSSSDPNMQNWPRDDLRLRYLAQAPEGYSFVAVDLDSIELVILGLYTGRGRMLALLKDPNGDPHTNTAKMVGLNGRQRSNGFESPRQQGKKFNYLKVYGGGINAISKWFLVPRSRAREMLEQFDRAYPEVAALDDQIQWKLARRGYIETLYGRRQRLPNEKAAVRKYGYKYINYLIQGTAADILKVATVRIHQAGIPLVATVHDELVALVPDDEAEDVAATMVTAMTDFPQVTERIPMGAEAQIVKRWSEAKDPDYKPEHER